MKYANSQLNNFVLLTYDLDSGHVYIYVDDEILKVLSIDEIQYMISNEIVPILKKDHFLGIYNSVIIVGNKIIENRQVAK